MSGLSAYDGKRFRIVKPGAYLEARIIRMFVGGSYSVDYDRRPLPVGAIIVSQGYQYSGGSDGIDIAQFSYGTFSGGFSPGCYGAPDRSFMVEIGDEGPDLFVEETACNDEDLDVFAAGFGVRASPTGEFIDGFPVYEYRGTRAALAGFLNCAYEDGSGDDLAVRYLGEPE